MMDNKLAINGLKVIDYFCKITIVVYLFINFLS